MKLGEIAVGIQTHRRKKGHFYSFLDEFTFTLMILTPYVSRYLGPDHLQLTFTQLGHQKCFGIPIE